jgi:hypothetical protein
LFFATRRTFLHSAKSFANRAAFMVREEQRPHPRRAAVAPTDPAFTLKMRPTTSPFALSPRLPSPAPLGVDLPRGASFSDFTAEQSDQKPSPLVVVQRK